MSGWEEARINSSNPLRYDRQSGEFLVVRAGLYYLYCQVSPTRGRRAPGGGRGQRRWWVRAGAVGLPGGLAGNRALASEGLDSASCARPAGALRRGEGGLPEAGLAGG